MRWQTVGIRRSRNSSRYPITSGKVIRQLSAASRRRMKSATSRFHSGRGNHETELERNGEKGIVVSGSLLNSPPVMAFVAATARSWPGHPGDDCALLRCHSRAVLQLRTIHTRRSRSRHSAENGDSPVGLWTHHLDVPGGSRLRSRESPVAYRQENPRRGDVAWLDRA